MQKLIRTNMFTAINYKKLGLDLIILLENFINIYQVGE